MTDDDFVKMLENLQRKIEYEEEQYYSKNVIHEYRNPSNFGVLDNPDAIGMVNGPCGDSMKITLKIKDSRILKVLFWTDGCGATVACGSMLTKIIKNKSLNEASKITSEALTNELGGLPKEHQHCSKLAVNTLKKAIKDYKGKKI